MKIAFKECDETIEEATQESMPTKETQNQTLWIIVSIIVITVVLIAVIVGLILVLRRRKDKPETTSQSGISTQTTPNSLPQFQRGSITKDIYRYHTRYIQSNTESTATTKTSVKSEAKPKSKKDIRNVVSPPKKSPLWHLIIK